MITEIFLTIIIWGGVFNTGGNPKQFGLDNKKHLEVLSPMQHHKNSQAWQSMGIYFGRAYFNDLPEISFLYGVLLLGELIHLEFHSGGLGGWGGS